ncbi:MAG: hypothetical protein LBC62_04485 [Treponema sp.]|jgi:hypothetical protein|nr:hypothetical protein [Treponema sp.]
MKPRPDPEKGIFNETPLDRAMEAVMSIKENMKDMKAALKAQGASLKDICIMLREAEDIFFQAKQNDLFQEKGIDFGGDIFAELVDIVGKEAAGRLVDYYSGSSIYIPKNIIIEQKHRKMRGEFKDGATYRELAARYEYSERYTRTIIHKKEQKYEQR